MLEAVKLLLAPASDIQLVGAAIDGLHAYEDVRTLQPDVLLTDLRLKGLPGAALIEKVTSDCPGVDCLILSGSIDPAAILEGIQAGARGFVDKTVMADEIVSAIRAVARGGWHLSKSMRSRLQLGAPPGLRLA